MERTWTSRASGTRNALNGVTYGNGIFVAVGDNATIIASTDRIDWIVRNSMPSVDLYSLKGVSYANGIFAAVGNKGSGSGFGGTVLTSPDGISWVEREIASSNANNWEAGLLNGITYGNGTFVAVGGAGTILASSDGIEWTSLALGSISPFLNGVTFGNNLFVAVSGARGGIAKPDPGMIVTSTDGIRWSSVALGADYFFSGVDYKGGMFVAVDISGGLSCFDVCFVGQESVIIFTSIDGVNWIKSLVNTRSSLNGISHGNDTFVVVGDDGVILQSDPLSGNCTATLSPEMTLLIPIINFTGSYIGATPHARLLQTAASCAG